MSKSKKHVQAEPVESSDSESSQIERDPKPPARAKRTQTEAQKKAFEKARQTLLENQAKKRAQKEEEERIKQQLKSKIHAKKERKQQLRAQKLEQLSTSEDSSSEEVIVKRKPRKVIEQPIINIHNHQKAEPKTEKEPLVRKSRAIFL